MYEELKDKEVKSLWYNTFILINKPVYFWGFTSYQLGGAVGAILFISFIAYAIFHLIVGTIIFLLMVIPMFFLMKKIRKENSKGNPNYVASYFLFKKAPNVITDNANVMRKIYRNEPRKYNKSIS